MYQTVTGTYVSKKRKRIGENEIKGKDTKNGSIIAASQYSEPGGYQPVTVLLVFMYLRPQCLCSFGDS